jgi:hypothetical protein
MMLVHESGHVLAAMLTGGTIQRVVWHPAVISRTDVFPNPHRLIEVSAGPAWGAVVPLVLALGASRIRLRWAYLLWFFAGFCLIVNGAYIGVGALSPVGDAQELLQYGAPRLALIAFGLIALIGGFWIWHRVSPRFGFGGQPEDVNNRDIIGVVIIAALVTALGWVIGNRG